MTASPAQLASAQCGADARLLSALRAAADPLRLQVLRLLARDAWNVAELCQLLAVGQPALSHHLKLLLDAGLIRRRKDGRSAFYRRALLDADHPAPGLLTALFEQIDARPLDAALAVRLDAVFDQRRRASEAFFARHAQAFRASQDLIAAPEQYLGVLAELVPAATGRALEVGPGDGAFLPTLAARASQVVAVDTAPEMITAARQRCTEEGLDNVTLEVADLVRGSRHPALVETFDVAVMAMVLHHSPRPEALLAAAAGRLRAGGLLLIAELCPHEQDWARDAGGDVWLGFDPDELGAWATAADLTETASQYLAQRNGFRLQVRAFRSADTTFRTQSTP